MEFYKLKKNTITYGLPHEIEDMLLNGISVTKCKKALKEYPEYQGKSSSELQNIIFTAHTYLMAEKGARDFEKDFEYYKISPVMDEKTCEKCKELSRMKFKFSERVPGKNFPPFHDGCRCSFVVVEPENWNEWMDDYVKKNSKKGFLNKILTRRNPK